MTLYEYIQLSDVKKAHELINATALASRQKADVECILYELYNFYVEVIYTKDKISIKPFQSTHYLQPYLQEIDISELHACLR